MALRYFAATAYAGRLYVQGVGDRGPWESRALVYWTEAQVDMILNERTGDRKVRTPEELRAAVESSRTRHHAMKAWIAEGLEVAARAAWEGH